jgi:hypothetical protein
MGESEKGNLFFSLYESQLVRVYLSSDEGNFLRNVSEIFHVSILTNEQLKELILQLLIDFKLDSEVEVIETKIPREPRSTRVVAFFLRWLDQTDTTKLKMRQMSRDNLHEKLKLSIRYLIHKFSLCREQLIKSLRVLYFVSLKNVEIFPKSSELVIYPNDQLFITSLTNFWEDSIVGVYFEARGCFVAGTIRSWDNLVSHGQLRFIPKIFVSHSQFITECATRYQNILQERIVELVTPSYRQQFRLRKYGENREEKRILYGSMGLITNPDDYNLVVKLIELSSSMPENTQLTILEHPKFRINVRPELLPENVNILCLPYETSNLSDYFQMLSECDLVICGGTSVLLDSLFVCTPVAVVHFEIQEQPYLKSAIRYFDTRVHTKSLFKAISLLHLYSEQDLARVLVGDIDVLRLEDSEVQYFTGNSKCDFDSAFLDIFRNSN